MLLVESKVMTMSANGLAIDDMEKAITIKLKKTPNNRKHHG